MPGIPSRKPRVRRVNIRSLTQALAGREAAYPVYRFSRRAFFELPSQPAQTFSGTDAPIITASDPSGIQATADFAGYQFQATTASGQAATWSVDPTGDPLPAGLDLSSTGLLTGTPTEEGSALVTVIATDPISGAFTMISTVITVESSPVSFSSADAPNSQQIDTAYAGYTYVATGGTGPYVYTVSAGGLPSGMTLSSAGLLSGTPDAAGVSIATIRATDNIGQFVETILTFSVVLPAAPEITSGVPSNPQRAVAYGGFLFTGTGFGTPTWDFSGVVPAGMTLDLNGTNQLTGTPTDFGLFPWTLRLTDAYGQVDEQSFVLEVDQAPAPVITSGAPGPFDQFVAITPFTLTASGGAGGYSWSIIGSLPAGLTFDGTDTISGTPTVDGTFPITVVVDDALGVQATAVYNISVTAAVPPVITLEDPLDTSDGALGYSYQFAGTTAFGPLTWSVAAGALPIGLSLSASGLLSGDVNSAASLLAPYVFAVLATDQNGLSTASSVITIEVAAAQPPPTPYVDLIADINPEYRMDFNSPYGNVGTESGTTNVFNPGQLADIADGDTPSGEGGLLINSGDYDQDSSSGYMVETAGWNIAGAAQPDTGTMCIVFKPEAGPNNLQYMFSINDGFDSSQVAFMVDELNNIGYLFIEEDGGNAGEAMFWAISSDPAAGGVDLYDGEWHSMIVCKHSTGGVGAKVDTYIDAWIDGYPVNGEIGQFVSQNPEYPDDFWFNAGSWSASGVDVARRPGSPVQLYSGSYDDWWYAEEYIMTDAMAEDIQLGLGLSVHVPVQTGSNSFNRIRDISAIHRWSFEQASGSINDAGNGISTSDVDLTSITGTVTYQQPGPFTGRLAAQISGGRFLDTNSGSFGTGWSTGVVFGWFRMDNLLTAQLLMTVGDSGGNSAWNIRVTTSGEIQYRCVTNGFANRSDALLDANVTTGDWHFVAVRQKADGTGVEIFFDGTWYTSADAAMTNTATGTGTINDWMGTMAARGRVALAGAAQTTNVLPLDDGRLWQWAADSRVVSDAEIELIWTEGVDYL